MIIEQLASSIGDKSEEPNIKLAQTIVNDDDATAVNELISALSMKQAIANDAIKVLYEIGKLNPELIAPHVDEFLALLTSKNNRLVWGSMTAISEIAILEAPAIFAKIEAIIEVLNTGSVIAIDNAVSVLAKVASVSPDYEAKIWPILLSHLSTCRPKEVPQHAERTEIAVTKANKDEFVAVLKKREPDLSAAQNKRVQKLIKALG